MYRFSQNFPTISESPETRQQHLSPENSDRKKAI